jgi:hypothetical protein
MSFEYNRDVFVPESSTDHALELLEDINTILTELGITNLLKPVDSNALWILCLAVGEKLAKLDELLYQATQSLIISNCDDDQIDNLLPIAGTEYITGAYSRVEITVTATGDGTCTIPEGSQLQYTADIFFETTDLLEVPAGTSDTVMCQCTQRGAIDVLPEQLNSFVDNFANLSSVTNLLAAVPGRADETPNQARLRLLQGKIIENNIEGAIRALRALVGINYANIYFNYDPENDLELPGGVTVSPRYARIIIYGESELIADTYAARMIAPTEGTESQIFESLSGQEIEIFYDVATQQEIYVKVLIPIDITLTDSQESMIKDIILNLSFEVNIGQRITQAFIAGAFRDFVEVEIIGIQLSLDDITYGAYVDVDADKVPTFVAEDISFENYEE